MSENTRKQIALPIVLCLGIAGGVLIGANMNTPKASKEVGQDVQKFKEVLTQINTEYVDEIVTTEMVDGAIQYLLNKLDPHSAYIPARDRIVANEDLRGNFEGIGIEFNIFQDTIVVVSPLSGGPSESLGIQSGDKIIMVDDELVAGIGITTQDVMVSLKGPKGSKVKVTIYRPGKKELIEYNIIRDKIPQFSVDASYMVNDEIGYIKINRFSATTYQEFSAALTKLKSQGMTPF